MYLSVDLVFFGIIDMVFGEVTRGYFFYVVGLRKSFVILEYRYILFLNSFKFFVKNIN